MNGKKFLSIILTNALALTLWSACGHLEAGEQVVVSGSSSVAPLVSAIADEYMKTHSTVIKVAASDSGTGIADAKSGLNDFGLISRELKESETGLSATKIALDGVALIVAPDCSVEDVTTEEIYRLYAFGTPVQSTITHGVDRERGSGTRDAFAGLIKDNEGNPLKKLPTLSDVITQANNTDVVKTQVAKNTALVGYISMGSLDGTVRALRLEGVAATREEVKAGNYLLSRPFLVVYRKESEMSEQAKAFMDYILSEEGQNIVEKDGYIGV